MFKNNCTIWWSFTLSSLLHFFYFIFSAPISISFFLISPSPFFLDVLSQAFIKHGSLIYIYIYIYIYIFCVYIFSVQFSHSVVSNSLWTSGLQHIHIIMYNIYIYFRELMKFCLIETFMTFWFHLFDLVWKEC